MSLRDLAIRYGFLVLLVGLCVFFTLSTDGFASPQAAAFICQSVAITGNVALGATATLVAGGFDPSIGAGATTAMMAAAYVMVVLDQNALVAVLPSLLAPTVELPWRSLGLTLLGVVALGLFTAWAAVRVSLRGPLLAALRGE